VRVAVTTISSPGFASAAIAFFEIARVRINTVVSRLKSIVLSSACRPHA